MSILGNRVQRIEDPALLRGTGDYVDDLGLDGAAHITYVTSTIAHAQITEIDVSETRDMPGVLGVWTGADLPFNEYPAPMFLLSQEMPRPMLATDVVRYVGEPIVAIATEEQYQGLDAAETVFVDYEPLDALVSPEEATTSAVTLHAAVEDNVIARLGTGTEADFSDCEVVVEQRVVNQRVAPSRSPTAARRSRNCSRSALARQHLFRERDGEHCPLPFLALTRERAPDLLDPFLSNAQPEPGRRF